MYGVALEYVCMGEVSPLTKILVWGCPVLCTCRTSAFEGVVSEVLVLSKSVLP
jgi:hypothetical protein